MDVGAADVVDHKSDICLTSDPQQSQTESDLTSCIADRVVDEGPAESLPPEAGLAPGGQALVRETGSPGRALVSETGSSGRLLVRKTGSPGKAPPVAVDESYEVTWTVDFAASVPKGDEEVKRETRGPRGEVLYEAPTKPQFYYHLEARLLPGPTEPLKADLVVLGAVVRLYRDNDAKTLRTWREGNRLWVSWSQSCKVTVTRELLEALLSHTILLRVWEGRDKVGSQARNDRYKAFRPLMARSEDDANGCVVVRDRMSWLKEVTERDPSKKKSHTKAERQRPPEEKSHKVGRGVKLQEQSKATATLANQNDNTFPSHKSGLQPYETTALDLENIKKNGLAWVECRPLCLVAGATSLAERFSVVRPSAAFEALCNISLDRVLMSEQLKAKLNPLVITILSANSLPSTPIPFPVLQEKCLPVYCQYQFHESKVHKTTPQRHGEHVHLDDVMVVLAGNMGQGRLWEYLTGPPLEIQVHDRDRKPQEAPAAPGLFGARPDDAGQLSSVAVVGRKRTAQDPRVSQVYESYGVAHLDLSGLVLGQRGFKETLPIRSGPPPQLLGRERPVWERKMMDLPGDADGHGMQPVQQGHYFASNAHLKVKVELAHPLSWDPAGVSEEHPPFGRVVFVFASGNLHALTRVRSAILTANAAAFNVGSRSTVSLDRVLSEYPLTPEERESTELDFVTGFHVQDEKMHLVAAEGLRHKAVKLLWETVPQKLDGRSEEQVRVLYSSGLGFFKRIYGSLDLGLSPVHLHRPLEDIMGNPQVYIRDMLPLPTFQALSRLSQLCQASRLLEVVRRDLLPTADMILSVSRDLGTVPGRTAQEIQVEEEEEEEVVVVVGNTEASSSLSAWERRRVPLDMKNTEFMEWKRRIKHPLDYVKENIRKVRLRSGQIQKPRRAEFGPEPAECSAAHNYSIQTFNSHRRALELLREEMAKEPGRRFTYSQLYQSATLEPGSFTHTPRGSGAALDFYSPREYPPRPDRARVEELKKPWKENILHANTLQAPLNRGRWPWGQRSLDFQVYPSATPYFGPPPPVPARLVVQGLKQELLLHVVGHQCSWPGEGLPAAGSRPDDHSRRPDFSFYRGAGSGKLRDILKDEPQKYSLRTPGLAFQPLPALAVLGRGSDEDQEAQYKALCPGPFPKRNLTAFHNAIPRRHSQYQRYRFKRCCVLRSFLHKRRSTPLTEPERAAPSPDVETRPPRKTGHFSNIVEVRTHTGVTWYTQ